MTQAESSPNAFQMINRPVCPKCGSPMWVSRIEQEGQNLHVPEFECPVCDISESGVVNQA